MYRIWSNAVIGFVSCQEQLRTKVPIQKTNYDFLTSIFSPAVPYRASNKYFLGQPTVLNVLLS